MMDPQIKADWIAALRSGKFEQTAGVLQRGNAYCCLGVLCAAAGKPITHDGSQADGNCYDFHWAGLSDGDVNDLWSANDSGKNFATIADLIEQNL